MLRVKDQAQQNERDTESAGSALEGGMWALYLCKVARERSDMASVLGALVNNYL
jgi:hypothetical protein